MDQRAIAAAAELLVHARRSGDLLTRLPESLRPANAAEAYAIELATVALLGDGVAGWKVATLPEFGLVMGVILASRVYAADAAVAAAEMPMCGVEAEIAYRFDRPLPARETPYERAEIEAAVTAFPAIEIVDSRFRSYAATPAIERAADFMSNGGFVQGEPRSDWRSFDLVNVEAALLIDGAEIVREVGGHAAKDPLLPAIDLVNQMRKSSGIAAGQVVTTGSYTGLNYAKPGSRVEAIFAGFGSAAFAFTG